MKIYIQIIYLLILNTTYLLGQNTHTYFIKLNSSISECQKTNGHFTDSLQKWDIHLKHITQQKTSKEIAKIYSFKLTEKEFNDVQSSLINCDEVVLLEKEPVLEILHFPNDPYSNSNLVDENGQTPLSTHDFYSAWDIEKGDSNITIGVVDTGIWFDHEDIKANIKYNENDIVNGINEDMDSILDLPLIDNYQGWDLADWDNDPTISTDSHGLQVAGLIAATPNNDTGTTGLAFNTKILPIKVSPDNMPNSITHGYTGLIYAAEHNCRVINLSWGGNQNPGQIYQDIIDYLVAEYDVIIVAAAGNSSIEEDYYPASYNNIISVTGIRPDTSKQNLSTYNYKVDLCAVGWKSKTLSGGSTNAYMNSSGTSFAAPVVSATAALLAAKKPNFTSQQIRQQLRVSSLIIDTFNHVVNGIHRDNTPYINKMGKMLNPARALSDFNIPGIKSNFVSISDTLSFPSHGRNVKVEIELTNILADASDITITIESLDPTFSFTTSQLLNFSLTQGDSSTIKTKLIVPANAPETSGTFPLKITYSGQNYHDYQIHLINYKYIECTEIQAIINYTQPDCINETGTISVKNLFDGANYRLNYNHNQQNFQDSLAPSSGVFILKDIEEGTYSNFTIDSLECTTDLELAFELNIPLAPTPIISVKNSSATSTDGQLIFKNLASSHTYEISYILEETNFSSSATANNNGTVIIQDLSRGTYNSITVDSSGCVHTSIIDQVIDMITDISYSKESSITKVFPNPFVNNINIESTANNSNVSIYSTSGELLIQKTNVLNGTPLNLTQLKPGSYILQIEAYGLNSYHHIVKL